MPPRGFLIVFGFFWTALTSVFLVIVGYGIVNQVRTVWFTQTTAVIDSIERTEQSGEDGPTYGVAVAYHYTVEGKDYRATRVRYVAGSSSDTWASGVMARMAQGSQVPAYYNPARPGEAVLIQGLEGSDLFLMQFLTPFALIMFGTWAAAARTFRRPHGVNEAGVMRRSRWMPLGVGLAVLGLAAFLAVFPVVIFFNGFHPPLVVAEISWICILTAAVAAGIATRVRTGAGQ